jgi:hypothetical protein
MCLVCRRAGHHLAITCHAHGYADSNQGTRPQQPPTTYLMNSWQSWRWWPTARSIMLEPLVRHGGMTDLSSGSFLLLPLLLLPLLLPSLLLGLAAVPPNPAAPAVCRGTLCLSEPCSPASSWPGCCTTTLGHVSWSWGPIRPMAASHVQVACSCC